ncbi:hypothetical protein [uncultured Campylobacter sp.]|uniref:hypothetical protein n=1 Tax=uncultured Campylobacter sp. TaxID=218934 RepID=UPI002637E380|nr:hypothetical protein [uncultured Campylobacter sp.]
MAENEHPDHLMCPFCGKDDIKYGAIVCGGCQAEISYSRSWIGTLFFSILWLFFGTAFAKDYTTLLIIVWVIGILAFIGALVAARDHSPQFHRTMKHVE